MDWLQRIGGPRDGPSAPDPPEEMGEGVLRRSAPGAAALFEGMKEGEGHAVLDLGPASEAHLSLYRGFARQICFGGLVPDPPRGRELERALGALPVPAGRSYDVVLLWDVLDRVGAGERRALMERLEEVTCPGARLYAVVEASEDPTTRPHRFTLTDRSSLVQEPVGPSEPAGPRLLPAEVERLLAPWEVERAFTLRVGLREYVAIRRAGG